MSFWLILVLILWLISAVGLVVLVLMHSGKGTGISDMLASSIYGTNTGTSVVEKNLDRITVLFALVFLVCLLIMMLIYPQGTM